MSVRKNKQHRKIKIALIIFAIAFIMFFIISISAATAIYSFIKLRTVSFAVEYLFSSFSLAVGFIGASVLVTFLIIYFVKFKFYADPALVNQNDRAPSELYGSNRLQTEEEMHRNYGYYNFNDFPNLDIHGIVVQSSLTKLKTETQLMLSIAPSRNALLIGTTGSGKSTYQLDMTIQANAHSKTKPSMVILDPKGVIYQENKLALEYEGYKINVIDLNNPRTSAQYNPMHLIYDYYHIYQKTKDGKYLDLASLLINELALTLIPTGRASDPKWEQGAQGVISGTIWAMLEDSLVPEFEFDESMFTLSQLSNIINKQKASLSDFLTLRSRTSPASEQAAAVVGISSEKTIDGYLSTIGASLRNFLDEGMKYLTSSHSVDMDFISNPTATFIIIPDSQSSRDVMGTLLITQLYRSLIMESTHHGDKLPRPVYFLIDEFGNLPKIDEFLKWISLCRSRNIYFELIVQSLGQIRRIYGETGSEEISACCPLQLFLGTTDEPTIEAFSKKFGTYTAYQHSRNVDIDKTGSQMHGNTSLVSRDVVRKEELRNIKMGELYFTEFRKYGCKSALVPIFDKRLRNILIYKNNIPEKFDKPIVNQTHYEEKTIDWDSLFYDIEKRNAIYNDNLSESEKTTPNGGSSAFEQEWGYDDNFNYAGIDQVEFDESASDTIPEKTDYFDVLNK